MIGLFLLALALAMDAFAVALVRGAGGGGQRLRGALETGLAFGAAQGLMPLAGWSLGSLFLARLAAVDHWIAFALLAFLGVRMLREGLGGGAEPEVAGRSGRSHYAGLALAAIATSIDAAAAGLTLELFGLPIGLACLIIALVTAALCIPAYWFAARVGTRIGRGAEVFGGLVLIALGIGIVFDHTGGL